MQLKNKGLRLKEFIKNSPYNQKEFAKIVGVAPNYISMMIKGTKPITDMFILNITKVMPEADISYITNTYDNIHSPPTYVSEGKIINDADYPTKEVYVIPIKGRGGLENAYYDDLMFKELEKEVITIKEPSSNGSKWFKIEVEGVSMDDGSKRSLAEGDWAYCRSIQRQYWKSKFHTHKWDIFCFFHNTRGVIFKKIKEQNTETGELLLGSLHQDKEQFPDFTINVAECTYICNVIKVLSEF